MPIALVAGVEGLVAAVVVVEAVDLALEAE